MTDVTPCNPHKEEDEGYLAAEAGRSLSDNIYPVGTDVFKWTAASRFVIRPDFYAGLLSLIALGWLALSKSFSRQLDVPTS